MSIKLLVCIVSLAAISAGHPIPDGQSQGLVQGVFISNEMLKSLQERAAQNNPGSVKLTQNNPDSAARNLNQALSDYNGLKINSASQDSEQPMILSSQQPITQAVATQTVPSQAVVFAQQASTNPLQPQQSILVSQQPNSPQPIVIQQPSVTNPQPVLVSPNSNQQQPIIVASQPSVTNQQPILVSQATQQQGVPQSQQPLLVAQTQNQPTFVLQNGQILSSTPAQTALVSGSLANGNQITLMTRPNQNQVFTMIPIANGQNTAISGTKSANSGSTYLVPIQNVQQVPGNQIYSLNAAAGVGK